MAYSTKASPATCTALSASRRALAHLGGNPRPDPERATKALTEKRRERLAAIRLNPDVPHGRCQIHDPGGRGPAPCQLLATVKQEWGPICHKHVRYLRDAAVLVEPDDWEFIRQLAKSKR